MNDDTTAWRLPAAESEVLFSGPDVADKEVLKLAFKELLLLDVLRLHRVKTKRLRLFEKDADVIGVTNRHTTGLPDP